MSAGPRMPIEYAREVVRHMWDAWGLKAPACVTVGSFRRGAETVGDLEFLTPHPGEGNPDTLYDAVAATLETGGLFGEGTVPIGRALKGFKRGFWSCDILVGLEIQATKPSTTVVKTERLRLEITIQLHRYEADSSNRGWKEIMLTGPSEFGQLFLSDWKRHHQIPTAGKASVDGHLVDRWGERVPVRNEEEAFAKCGKAWVPPGQREEIARRFFKRAGA